MSVDTGKLGPLREQDLRGTKKVDTPKALLASPGPPLTKIRLTDLRRALLRQRNFKAHPQDTLPPEIWKILARFYPDFLKIMDKTTLAAIRRTRTAPTLWSLSPMWPVPKHNGKQGLQGKRLVNGVHSFSRAFMRLSYKRPIPSPLRLRRSCGQAKGRSGGSGAQHSGKMLESRQVLPFQAQGRARWFHKRHARVSSAALGSDAETTRSSNTPQSASQHDFENARRVISDATFSNHSRST